ncbi:MAG: hypothetical protein ACTSRG_17585 [Candidatus Helarchaeota archaeon]
MFPEEYWTNIRHFYFQRCDLYHEEGEKTITDINSRNYYLMILDMVEKLFSLESSRFSQKLRLKAQVEY